MKSLSIRKSKDFNSRFNKNVIGMQKEGVDLGIFSILSILKCTKEIHNKSLFRTQIAKLLYLTHKLKRIDVGYNFEDDNYGPYDKQIGLDLKFSKDIGNIKEEIIDKEYVNLSTKYSYQITEKGENSFREYSKQFDSRKIIESIKKICEKYGKLSTRELLDLVYKRHYRDYADLKEDIMTLQANLKKLYVVLDKQYQINFSKVIDSILLKIEYSKYILNKLDKISSKTDQNILFQEIKDLFNEVNLCLGDIERISCMGELDGIFTHLNHVAKENGLFTYDDDSLNISEFLDDEDFKCLMKNTIEVS